MEAEKRHSPSQSTRSTFDNQIIPQAPLESRLTRSKATKTHRASKTSFSPEAYQLLASTSPLTTLPPSPPQPVFNVLRPPTATRNAQQDLEASQLSTGTRPNQHVKLLATLTTLAQCSLLSTAAALTLLISNTITPSGDGFESQYAVWLVGSFLIALISGGLALTLWLKRRKARRSRDHARETQLQLLERLIIDRRTGAQDDGASVVRSADIHGGDDYLDDDDKSVVSHNVLISPGFLPPRGQSLNSWRDMMRASDVGEERGNSRMVRVATVSPPPEHG